MKLGDIRNGVDYSKKRIWDEYDASDMIGCSDCEHNSCYRCVAENYEKTGSPFIQIRGSHCKLMLIDLKYQKLIKKELTEMGLINQRNGKKETNCQGHMRDCVGKQGDCPVVTSVDDCVFENTKNSPKNFKDVVPESNTETCCQGCGDNKLKDVINDIIEVLVKHHNKF